MKNWLKITLFTITVLIGSASFATFVLSMTAPQPVETAIVTPVVQDRPLLDLVNELRAEKGVHLLTASPELDKSAQDKANDMATRHYYGHISPDGVQGYTLISNYLPSTTRRSENLMICGDSAGAFDAWLKSPAHYRGMIDPRVTLYGEGKAWDDQKKCTVYVNHFAAV